MDMQQMMEMLVRMDASMKTDKEEMLARMEANMKSYQERMEANRKKTEKISWRD